MPASLASTSLLDECLFVGHFGGPKVFEWQLEGYETVPGFGDLRLLRFDFLDVFVMPRLHRSHLQADHVPLPSVTNASLASTMFRVTLDRAEQTALHEQVAAEIRRAIAEGEAHPGERLPPARDLAAVLGVNANTVFRALRLLREEGLLEFRRGRGVTVAGTPERGAVLARARALVQFAREQGFRRDELVRMIEHLP